ncbi:MAG: hypothetical protein ACR2NY_02555 [Alphaproteobacteria bacterium]
MPQQKPTMFLLPHGGLGDMLVLNGMVRHLAKKYKIILVIMWRTRHEAKFLLQDIDDLSFYIIYSDHNIAPIINGVHYHYNHWKIKMLKKCGFHFQTMGTYLPNPSITNYAKEEKKGQVHDILYQDMNMPINWRYDKFELCRNKKNENDFYHRAIKFLKTKNYIVVHDDPKRNFMINHKKIPNHKNKKTKIFYIGKDRCAIKNHTIFDTITLLEKAKSFHGFDSSFMWLIELLKLKTPSYLHATKARPYHRNKAMTKNFRKKWILVK